ncbi:signal recognition particle 19 kDa protein isoform X2 [Procambarus clarkii]|uniref:signal recognition particle 19 kDa protein isoform X2 n=1 Tax=Procambarus clarkii TaxID=6728 RepID=UPI00374418D8
MMAAAATARPVTKLPDGFDRWICLYPAYINKDKSRAEGRRIPKDKVIGERKIYCREKSKEPPYWGRVRVQLKNQAGEPVNPKFSSREDVMIFTADKIPQLKTRTNPKHSQDAQQQQGKQGKGKKKK